MSRSPIHEDVEFWRDQSLPGLELRTSTYRQSVFREHTHSAYSVGLIDSGSTSFGLLGERWHASQGDVVVIGPEEPHSCNPDSGSLLSYRMLYVEPAVMVAAVGEPPMFSDPIIFEPDVFASLDELFVELVHGRDLSCKRRQLESVLQMLVAEYADVSDPGACLDAPLVEAAKAYLKEHLADRMTLDELAGAVGVSRSYLCRAFRAAEGLPPHAYRNQLRVERAKQLLREGAAPSDVAMLVGFADQSHLNRVFRESTGATPRQYQESASR